MTELIAKYRALMQRQQEVERELNVLWTKAQPLTGELAQLRDALTSCMQEIEAAAAKEKEIVS